jgi:hypothetical protein
MNTTGKHKNDQLILGYLYLQRAAIATWPEASLLFCEIPHN